MLSSNSWKEAKISYSHCIPKLARFYRQIVVAPLTALISIDLFIDFLFICTLPFHTGINCLSVHTENDSVLLDSSVDDHLGRRIANQRIFFKKEGCQGN